MGEEREDPSDSSKQLFHKDNGTDMRREDVKIGSLLNYG